MKRILTPDQRIRVFISSTLQELAPERKAAKRAITQLRMTPVMFESGASSHPPREMYRAQLEQSHIFLGIYWQEYGWIAPDMTISGIEDEYNLSGSRPKLVYIKRPALVAPRLGELLHRIQNDGVSYKTFSTVKELRDLIANDLAHTLAETSELLHPALEGREALKVRHNNLPAELSSFVGRVSQIKSIRARLSGSGTRLLTLTGPPGTGKTRLAREAGRRLLRNFHDGVCIVDLAPLTDHNLVASAIAKALGLNESGGKPIEDTLEDYLSNMHLLLILDNFERIMAAAAMVVRLLSKAPRLKMLVTSREPLSVSGETRFRVPPLTLPDSEALPPVEKLTEYEAVKLFMLRAQSVDAHFQLDNDNAQAVAEICTHLDGLPLAIELAAARIERFKPKAMLPRLQSRLELLRDGPKDLSPHQQNLRTAIEWSYDLLSEGEQQLFRRMAPFNGGRTLEALEAVCNFDGKLEVDVFTGVWSLLNKSLLEKREGRNEEPRFWMLETLHEYAREKLEESGEAETLQRQHAMYFMRFVEKAKPELIGEGQAIWLDALESEHDNLRTALAWSINQVERIQGRDEEDVLIMTETLSRFWEMRGHLTEGRKFLRRLLDLVRAKHTKHGLVFARALNVAGRLAWRQGDYEAASVQCQESLNISLGVDDMEGVAFSMHNLGNIARDKLSDYKEARKLFEGSLNCRRRQIGEESGGESNRESKWGEALTLCSLGEVESCEGELEKAHSLLEASVEISGALGDKWILAMSLMILGHVEQQENEVEAARERFLEGLQTSQDMGDRRLVGLCLAGLGGVAVRNRQFEQGAKLLGLSEALLETVGARLTSASQKAFDKAMQIVVEQLSDKVFKDISETAKKKGRDMSMEQAIAYALAERPI